jgi:hypothetical protein
MTKSQAIRKASTLIFDINVLHYTIKNEKEEELVENAKDSLKKLETEYEQALRIIVGIDAES